MVCTSPVLGLHDLYSSLSQKNRETPTSPIAQIVNLGEEFDLFHLGQVSIVEPIAMVPRAEVSRLASLGHAPIPVVVVGSAQLGPYGMKSGMPLQRRRKKCRYSLQCVNKKEHELSAPSCQP